MDYSELDRETADILKHALEKAKDQNQITSQELEVIEELQLPENILSMFYTELEKMGIKTVMWNGELLISDETDPDFDSEDLDEFSDNVEISKTNNEGFVYGGSIENYLLEMGQHELLTHEEEIELGKKIIDGDLEARDRMILCNLRLVVHVAKHYKKKANIQLQDIIQDGNLGLIRAVEKYDYTKGYRFSTYATYWIKQSIMRAIANEEKNIRLPIHLAEDANKISRYTKDFLQEYGTVPNDKQISSALGFPIKKIKYIVRVTQDTVSLNTPIDESGENVLEDVIMDNNGSDPHEQAEKGALKAAIEEVLKTLNPREEKILRMRFGFEDGTTRTLEEVGSEFGVTRERVRQIEKKALNKMRKPSTSHILKDFAYSQLN